ncbi:hypothetical protein [Micromonospora sp. LH3U1]|uniref:hypothetical protein n=1 Tax=Micromonospora sp. LH3U1 TaxID=3018339 RepID=UPI00234C00B6|nr:hypothetical protein [Micromonospora sp. LH3U1]WCN83468.1 hypothetical protein PCA76_10620 [Micromonospora sp. LH3U1]
MLPVALTCPLWWVARWATRVLTSLAVAAALALGAGPATAVAPTLSAVPSAVPIPFAAGSLAASCRPTVAQGPAQSARAVPERAAEKPPAWSVDSLPGGQVTVATGVLPVCAPGPDPLPLVGGPSSRAPRAPPGR